MFNGRRRSTFLLIALALAALAALRGAGWLRSDAALSPPVARPGYLVGRVVVGRNPIGGAIVRLKGTNLQTLSDCRGFFSLAVSERIARTITAWREGYLIGGAPADESPLVIQLKPVPRTDNEDYEWVDPTPSPSAVERCGNCHEAIYDEWRADGHATAATNPFLMNLYEGTSWTGASGKGWSLLDEHPHGAAVCASCHAPSVGLTEPGMNDLRQVAGVAVHGVHCDFCHKVSGVAATGEPGITHGRFGLSLTRPSQGQLFFGPLDDVDRGEDAYSPLQRQSHFCASCHEGVVFGVHVYSTYSEWQASPAAAAGKQCQSCHMRPSGELTNIAPGNGGHEREPHTLASHMLLPGGREGMLKSSLELSGRLSRNEGQVSADLELVARNVGHRVPTGFIDRHLMLVVEARDAKGRSVPLVNGPRLSDPAGKLAGKPGLLFAKLLYDQTGKSPAPFWRIGVTAIDNRLEPERPVRLRFTFPGDTAQVNARVLYRRFWEEQRRVKAWPDDTIVVIERVFSTGVE